MGSLPDHRPWLGAEHVLVCTGNHTTLLKAVFRLDGTILASNQLPGKWGAEGSWMGVSPCVTRPCVIASNRSAPEGLALPLNNMPSKTRKTNPTIQPSPTSHSATLSAAAKHRDRPCSTLPPLSCALCWPWAWPASDAKTT